MKGTMSAQKAFQGSQTETKELLEEWKRIVFPRCGVIDLPSRQTNDFFYKKRKQKKVELVSRPVAALLSPFLTSF